MEAIAWSERDAKRLGVSEAESVYDAGFEASVVPSQPPAGWAAITAAVSAALPDGMGRDLVAAVLCVCPCPCPCRPLPLLRLPAGARGGDRWAAMYEACC